MEPVKHRPGKRSLTPAIEGMEARCLMAAPVTDIAMFSATTHDSKSVTFDYNITGANTARPVHFEVYRSAGAQLGPDAVAIAGIDIPSDIPAIDPGIVGSREQTIPIPGGLPPDPKQPYVLVVADPQNAVAETNEANNTASFRTYTIGVVSHGGLQPRGWSKAGPPWEYRMANKLASEGYDAVIPFNWVGLSGSPGAAAGVAPKLESLILQTAAQFPANAPVDIHFIGHSEGAVVNSQALLKMNQAGLPANVRAGYLKMTMLDPHAANNAARGPQYSVGEGPLGWLAKQAINAYQSRAQDPLVVVPPNVQSAEVFFQHTPVRIAGTNHGLYNLWGQVPLISGQASYFDLTAKGVSHGGKYSVHDWYSINVVPTLGDGGTFVATDSLTGSRVTTAPETVTPAGRRSLTYAGTAAPEAPVRLFAGLSGTKALKRIGATRADAQGHWQITSRPIATGTYRIDAVARATQGPRRRPPTMRPTAWFGRVTVGPASAVATATT